MKPGKVIVLHSYKGGTGKTTLVANIAALYAKKGYKSCLLDMDVYAPSLASYFRLKPRAFLNDVLEGDIQIEDCLQDISKGLNVEGELYVGLSNPTKEDVQNIEIKHDQKWQVAALKKFLGIKKQLIKENNFDYIFLDTSPGIRFWSINALAASDVLLMLMKVNDMDLDGTKKMISEIYDLLTNYGSTNYLILNKVGGASPVEEHNDVETITGIEKEVEKSLGMPVIHSIPCFCDLQFNRHEYLSTLNQPDHGFSQKIFELVEKLEKLQSN
jgi:chromosome partitioning protein